MNQLRSNCDSGSRLLRNRSVAPPPIARVIALVTAVAVLTGHLGTVKVRLVYDQKTHQKADNGNEHESVEYKTRCRGQTVSRGNPAPKHAPDRLIGCWACNRHIGDKRDQVVEAHLLLSGKNFGTKFFTGNQHRQCLLGWGSAGVLRKLNPEQEVEKPA